MHRLVGVLGMLTMMGLAFLFSTNRRAIREKTVAWGLVPTNRLRLPRDRLGLRPPAFPKSRGRRELGPRFRLLRLPFVFGDLGKKGSPMGFFFAFQVLPTIIFIAAVFALLYYCGVMQLIIKQAARVMTRLMGASGAESLNVAASIFMGQTEAPLTIRPYSPRSHAIRIDDHHDQRHGPRFRRHDGGLHRLRHRSQASPRRRDHDRARDNPAFENDGPRNRSARDFRPSRTRAVWSATPMRLAQ